MNHNSSLPSDYQLMGTVTSYASWFIYNVDLKCFGGTPGSAVMPIKPFVVVGFHVHDLSLILQASSIK